MKVLVACEYSGIVRDAFSERGHDAMSCDILPSESKGPHYQGDMFDIVEDGWDIMIVHPPCTYLCVSGNRWMNDEYKNRFPTRIQDRSDAIDFFMKCVKTDIDKICIENPVGIMSTKYKKPTQYIQPWEFGEHASKKTGLWLKNLPLLHPVNPTPPITEEDKKEYLNWHTKTLSLQSNERQKIRTKTFPGIANAMASQWGCK